jgi:hypothetical protein
MSTDAKENWANAKASLEPSLRPLLDELAQDYRQAARIHTKYQGGPMQASLRNSSGWAGENQTRTLPARGSADQTRGDAPQDSGRPW